MIITGTNLTGATAVDFGATPATNFTPNTATQVTAVSPAGSAGAVDVTVTTPGGISATSANDKFTFTALPTVTAVSPTTGTATGGQTVTVTGTNLAGATAVDFGAGNAGTTIVVNGAGTSLTVVSPAVAAGLVDVTVTTPGGPSATSASDHYTFVSTGAPTVTALSPTGGPVAGGTSVTVTGTNFTGATLVNFGTTGATNLDVVSDTSITATSPAGSAGAVDVTVTAPGGISAVSAADKFTYGTLPTVTAISPTTGPAAGGTSVTVTGTNFTGATAVDFGTTAATNLDVVSATSVTATSPAGTGMVDVTVITPVGTSATSSADQFTYAAALSVTTTSLAGATVGTAYSATLAAAGGTTPYSWAVTTGTLPTGLSLGTSSGDITGTPTTAGTSDFTVTVTDSTTPTAQTATASLSIVVTGTSGAVAVATTSLAGGTIGSAYSATLTATGGTAPYSWAVTAGSLPTGLSLGTSGAITGTPLLVGTTSFTVTVTDSTTPTAETATAALSITVAAPGSGSGGTGTGTGTGSALASTGASIERLLQIALGAILLGVLLMLPIGRRRVSAAAATSRSAAPGLMMADRIVWSQWRSGPPNGRH